MSWFNVWDGLKNKTCRYLLQRYLGQFLEEKLHLEQLKIELYSGKATVKNVSLNIASLNGLCAAQGWGLEVVSGHIGEINVTVPWNALMTKDSSIEVSDLNISVRPIKRENTGSSMLESMWSSASSSIQMAEECMKQNDDSIEDTEAISNAIIGLEKFAETIDNVLNRINAHFLNTVLNLEYLCNDGSTVICLVMTINEIIYKNETGCEKTNEKISSSEAFTECSNFLPSFAKHKVKLIGIRIYTHESTENSNGSNTMKNIESMDDEFNNETRIPIMEIFDEQKIEVKMKQSEEVSGPKIFLSVELGSIYNFITPRQMHLLFKLIGAFYDDPIRTTGDHINISKSSSKSELNNTHSFGEHLTNMTGIIGNNINWNNDFEDKDNSFHTEDNRHGIHCESLTSSMSSNSTITNTKRYQRALANTDSCVHILDFSARINSFVGVFLYEDEAKSHLSSNNNKQKMTILKMATHYFNQLKYVNRNQTQDMSLLCGINHLNLRLKPVFMNGIQQRNKNVFLLKFLLTAAKIDLCEVLEGSVCPLLCFDRFKDTCDEIRRKPEINIQFSSTSSCNLKDEAISSIEIDMDKCIAEFDISIYDRLSGYVCQSPFQNCNRTELSHRKDFNDFQETILISISCRELNIKLRFPIVDMRSAHDRTPWWKQNIRADFLLVSMTNLLVEYKINFIDINSTEVNAYYCESDISTKVHLLTTQRNDLSCKENKELKIAIQLHQYNSNSLNAENGKEKSESNHPFSSRKECRHSDTVHSVHDTEDNFENLFLPGEREEVKRFCCTAMKNSYVSVHIYLPIARAYLESKCVYEILYNRINSDLLMWEPSSPFLTKSKLPTNMTESVLCGSFVDSIYIPHAQSKNLYETIDEGMDYNGHSSSLYFSTYENSINGRTKKQLKNKYNHFTLEIMIQEGSLTLLVPVRDSLCHVLPGQLGKFDFIVNGLNICSVSGFNGNADLGYVCIQLKNIEVYHCGLVPVNVQTLIKNGIEEYMQSIFYATPEGLTKGNKSGIKEREMMSVVIEIKKNPRQKVKRLKITLGVQKTTLRHYPARSSLVWLNQLIDFFDILDFPIEGFLPYGVISEIQLKLWDCAIDYRPKLLEFRTIIEIGSFSMSSNIISSVSGCNLRFALEDCVLSLAPFDSMKNMYPESMVSSIPSDNLVPVIEIGLLDISLRLKDDYSPKHPKMDLRFSVHDFHLRTCYDSFCGLSQLITHIGHDSDVSINDDFDLLDSNINLSTCTNSEIFSSKNKLEELEMERKQQERINVLMAEAVQEIGVSQNSYSQESFNKLKDGIEVYYFPDENTKKDPNIVDDDPIRNEFCDILNFESNVMLNSYYSKPDVHDTLPQVKQDLGDININLDGEQHSIGEEGFCMVSGNAQNHIGIKNIEITDDPLRIVDNHFCLPNAKSDLLQAPDNFPTPVIRYTLCEMTFTWHIYGGNDFPEESNTTDISVKNTSECPKMSEAYKHGVSYSKCSKNIQFGKKPKEKLTWKTIGGPKRNHEILVEMQFTKIRVSHEEYPLYTSHASRQVILINDIEIRDRLQISDINKFLYHPNNKTTSNKNSRDMIVVKALHIRPNQKLSNEQECSLRISVLPLRLNIDQNTLIFISDFFGDINEKSNSHNFGNEKNKVNVENAYIEEPVMTMQTSEDLHLILPEKVVTTNLDLLMNDRNNDLKEEFYENKSKKYKTVQPLPIYFREIVFSPDLPICFDYQGHKIEFSRGPIVGLLMGLGQLECSEIRLNKITHRRGILGIDKLIKFLCKEWLTDIKKNQLSKILKGVGPTKAFKQLFDGIYDLFRLPFEQYQKDGRIIRGLQLGAQSFTARTALAALEITARVLQLLQFTAETAFDMVSPGPSVRQKRKTLRGKKRRSNRPKDIREGVTNAYIIVKEGINDSANNLFETAVSEHDQKGYAGAVGAVMRQIPQLVVCPAVLATQATNNILGGVKSSLVPEAKVEAREKWKDESD